MWRVYLLEFLTALIISLVWTYLITRENKENGQ